MSQPDTGHDLLRFVPSRGWVGRRDRALLVLSRVAGLSYPDIVDLTTADVTISDGTARIRGRAATITLRSTDDTMLCGALRPGPVAARARHGGDLPRRLRGGRGARPVRATGR
jgi:hypothetical protein